MASKQYTKINELLERARIEGDWGNVSQYAQALPNEQSTLRFVSLAECMLEQTLTSRESGRYSYDSLHLAKDYLKKALAHQDKTNQSYKEAILLQAKMFYVQGKFQECLDTLSQVDLDLMKKECLSFNVSRALADAFVYKGMSMEQLRELLSASVEIEGIIECYESAADLGLALMGSTTRSSFNLTLSGVLEMALLRSILLQMKHGQVDKGLVRLRRVLQLADVQGLDGLRVKLCITLGQVLIQGVPDTAWPPIVSRDSPTVDNMPKIGPTKGRATPVQKKYESMFCPCNKTEEGLLILLIGQALLYKEGCVSLHEEDTVMCTQTSRQTHSLLNMMVLLMGRFGQYRALADTLEKFLKFSYEDLYICKQFGLALLSSGQYCRGAAVLEKCHETKADIPIALTIAKTYINQLQRYEKAISICTSCLAMESKHLRSRLYLYKGIAEAALTRSTGQRTTVNSYSKAAVESLYKAYSLDPNCPHILYHLALRLATVGEIRKSVRFARKVAENPGVVQMADIAHLLALLFSAQHKGEEALSIVELYLIDYPDNLNLLITRVLLERVVEGPTKALVTCKEVLIPLIERLSGGLPKDEQTFLPYSDQWTSGKFQLTQWSDRVSTHTTASFSGSTMGTLPAESISESIDSAVGCDQSNWGSQAEVWYTIADVFLSDSMLPDSQKCIDEVRQLFPLSHLVSYMNGRIREAEGQLDEAEQQYINSVTLSPRHVPSLVALGRLQIDLGKPLLAEHYLTEATKAKPDQFEAWHHLGVLHQGQENHQQATECFLTSLRFESTSPIRPYTVLQWKI